MPARRHTCTRTRSRGAAAPIPPIELTLDKKGPPLAQLAHNQITRLRVEGHTDNTGNPASNVDLSKRRAAAVVAALGAKGVSRDRLTSTGLGDTKPLGTNATDDGRQMNRRVEFHIER